MQLRTSFIALAAALALAGTATTAAASVDADPAAPQACPAPGGWMALSGQGRSLIAPGDALADLARRRVVLLGESHDSAEHHRWQLHTIAALHARQPGLVLAFEMFPRSVQPILDRWSAGELTERQFLQEVDWNKVWGHDAALYLPIFHFARMHRIPMLALNVERALARRVGSEGFSAIPPDQREGVGTPAPASPAYLELLYQAYLGHLPDAERRRQEPTAEDLRDPAFLRFVDGMQLWDRAMAQGIAERLAAGNTPLIVALMGAGHLRDGFGVPHQLQALAVTGYATVLPLAVPEGCADLEANAADMIFGIAYQEPAAPEKPRLGIALEQGASGVTIRDVVKDSIAAQAGARTGDVITRLAGVQVKDPSEVIAAVQRQAPGTWLPFTVQRDGKSIDLVARFPPAP